MHASGEVADDVSHRAVNSTALLIASDNLFRCSLADGLKFNASGNRERII